MTGTHLRGSASLRSLREKLAFAQPWRYFVRHSNQSVGAGIQSLDDAIEPHGAPLTEPATATPPVSELSSALVRRAQRGDVNAFEGLYRQNVGRVHALCLRMTGDPVAAEELTQSVWVRAWERLGTFRGESAFSTWIHRLAVNVVLSERRSESRRRDRIEFTDMADELDRGTPPPATETRLALERAVADLPEGARTVFVLHDVEGYRHADIAEKLGTAVGTVKSQLHRARRLLREALT